MKITVEMTKEEFLEYVKLQDSISSLKYQIRLVQDKIQTQLIQKQELKQLLFPIYQDLGIIKDGGKINDNTGV